MRAVIVACALLAGCAAPGSDSRSHHEKWRDANRDTPAGKADAICVGKTQFAMATWRSRSVFDLEGTAIRNDLYETCMDTWRRTGQTP
jgi:hypothetical protein